MGWTCHVPSLTKFDDSTIWNVDYNPYFHLLWVSGDDEGGRRAVVLRSLFTLGEKKINHEPEEWTLRYFDL